MPKSAFYYGGCCEILEILRQGAATFCEDHLMPKSTFYFGGCCEILEILRQVAAAFC